MAASSSGGGDVESREEGKVFSNLIEERVIKFKENAFYLVYTRCMDGLTFLRANQSIEYSDLEEDLNKLINDSNGACKDSAEVVDALPTFLANVCWSIYRDERTQLKWIINEDATEFSVADAKSKTDQFVKLLGAQFIEKYGTMSDGSLEHWLFVYEKEVSVLPNGKERDDLENRRFKNIDRLLIEMIKWVVDSKLWNREQGEAIFEAEREKIFDLLRSLWLVAAFYYLFSDTASDQIDTTRHGNNVVNAYKRTLRDVKRKRLDLNEIASSSRNDVIINYVGPESKIFTNSHTPSVVQFAATEAMTKSFLMSNRGIARVIPIPKGHQYSDSDSTIGWVFTAKAIIAALFLPGYRYRYRFLKVVIRLLKEIRAYSINDEYKSLSAIDLKLDDGTNNESKFIGEDLDPKTLGILKIDKKIISPVLETDIDKFNEYIKDNFDKLANVSSEGSTPALPQSPEADSLEEKMKKEEEELLKKQEEERKRQEAEYIKKQEEERKKQEEERKKQEAETLKKQEEERKRQEAETLKKQEEERKRQEAETLKKQEEERKKQEAETLKKQEEERKKQEAETLKKQDEEKKEEEELLKKQEEEMKREGEEFLKKQEEERKRQEAEYIKKQEEERKKQEEERKRQEAETLKKQDEEKKRQEAEEEEEEEEEEGKEESSDKKKEELIEGIIRDIQTKIETYKETSLSIKDVMTSAIGNINDEIREVYNKARVYDILQGTMTSGSKLRNVIKYLYDNPEIASVIASGIEQSETAPPNEKFGEDLSMTVESVTFKPNNIEKKAVGNRAGNYTKAWQQVLTAGEMRHEIVLAKSEKEETKTTIEENLDTIRDQAEGIVTSLNETVGSAFNDQMNHILSYLGDEESSPSQKTIGYKMGGWMDVSVKRREKKNAPRNDRGDDDKDTKKKWSPVNFFGKVNVSMKGSKPKPTTPATRGATTRLGERYTIGSKSSGMASPSPSSVKDHDEAGDETTTTEDEDGDEEDDILTTVTATKAAARPSPPPSRTATLVKAEQAYIPTIVAPPPR